MISDLDKKLARAYGIGESNKHGKYSLSNKGQLIRAKRTVKLLGISVALLAAAAVATSPASAAPTTPTSDGVAPTASTISPVGESTVVASADWGVTNGHAWYAVTQGTLVSAPAGAEALTSVPSEAAGSSGATAVAVTMCHEEISNVTLGGAGLAFHWTTEQICTGNFLVQSLKTQLWRSSWSGPRGYTSWSYSDITDSTQLGPIYGGIGCHVHSGYYDYYPVMQGKSSFGSGPVIRSGNTLKQQPCGPSA